MDQRDDEAASAAARSGPPPRVLVVDDERFFREAIRDALESAGCIVTSAEHGAVALELADAGGHGVVVLDVEMPGMSGIEVLRRLRESHPEVRVIILSAHTGQERVIEALRLGASDYLAKPLHDEELVLAVRRAHAVWRESHELARLRRRVRALADWAARLARVASDPEVTEGGPSLAARVAEAAAQVLDAAKTSLVAPDPDGHRLRVIAATGRSLALDQFESLRPGDGLAGEVFAEGLALVTPDASVGDLAARLRPERYRTRSFALAPVPHPDDERPAGVLCATDRATGEPFDLTDLALLELLARLVAPVVVPARTSADATDEDAGDPDVTLPDPPASANGDGLDAATDADLELARRVCEVVSREVEPSRVLGGALRAVAESLDAAPVSLYLVSADGDALVCEAQADGGQASDHERLPIARGLTGSVLATGGLVATGRPDSDPRFEASVDSPPGETQPRPLLCIPLVLRGRTLGVVRAFLAPGRTPSARSAEVAAQALAAALRSVLLYRSLVDSIEEVARVRRESRAALV